MLHYIISKRENITRAVLYRLLYFCDFDNYEKYEKSITGETYIRKRTNPAPVHFKSAVNELIDENKISEIPEIVINYSKFKYSSLAKPDLNLLTEIELKVIDDTLNRIPHSSDYSHGDIALRLADEGEALNYEAVFYREPQYSVRDYELTISHKKDLNNI